MYIAKKPAQFAQKLLIMGLIIVLLLVGYLYFCSFGYLLIINGEKVGILPKSSLPDLTAFIIEMKNNAEEAFRMEVVLNEKLDFVPCRRLKKKETLEAIKDELRQRLSYSTYGYILLVNGTETVALSSEEDYTEVVQSMKETYLKDKEDIRLRDFTIQADIDFIRRQVAPDEIVSVEEAANILLSGLPRQRTHLVARGESLWSISRANNMTIEELEAANPHIKNKQVKPNDELKLVKAEPLVAVLTVEEVKVTERIPFRTIYVNDSSMYTAQTKVKTAGRIGEKEIIYHVTKENGVEIKREKVGENIIREPINKIIAKGTKPAPKRAVGRFIWPLASGGTITSHFGPRWGRMHYGVDIAAAAGTSVRAADGGVVKISSYQGSYGNLVVIDHGNGYSTYYAHNSRLLVNSGERVVQGQTIALVGSTGNSTGNHVHFEIRKNGTPVNPLNFF
ncbi:MAG: peptidoglycan DD-metalloendopeptidase family protein [Firmicutes bacterium]|nr:peptidoglycan DD-metalloendopeptidase family protein [Bacillota bacterium]